jgi:hypothetical protein
MGPDPISGVRLRHFEMEEKFKSYKKDWGLDGDALEKAIDLYKEDYGEDDGSSASDLLLFLYAKGILAQKKSAWRRDEFEELLAGETDKSSKASQNYS